MLGRACVAVWLCGYVAACVGGWEGGCGFVCVCVFGCFCFCVLVVCVCFVCCVERAGMRMHLRLPACLRVSAYVRARVCNWTRAWTCLVETFGGDMNAGVNVLAAARPQNLFRSVNLEKLLLACSGCGATLP